MVGAGSPAAKCELRRARTAGGVKSGSGGGEGQDGGRGRSWCSSRAPRTPGLATGSSRLFLHRFFLPLLRSFGVSALGRRGTPFDFACAAFACTPEPGARRSS